MMRRSLFTSRAFLGQVCRPAVSKRLYSLLDDKKALLEQLKAKKQALSQENSKLAESISYPSFSSSSPCPVSPSSSTIAKKEQLVQALTKKRDEIVKENERIIEEMTKKAERPLAQKIPSDESIHTVFLHQGKGTLRDHGYVPPTPPTPQPTKVIETVYVQQPPQIVERVVVQPEVIYASAPSFSSVPPPPPPPPYYAQPTMQTNVAPPSPPPPSSMPIINIVNDEPSPWPAFLAVGGLIIVAGCVYYFWKHHRAQQKQQKEREKEREQEHEKENKEHFVKADAEKEKQLDDEIARLQKEIAEDEAFNARLKKMKKEQ